MIMKRFTLLVLITALATLTFAGELIQIQYNTEKAHKALFKQSGISIHYSADDFVLATHNGNFSGDYAVLDQDAFAAAQAYYIAWFYKGQESEYVEQVQELGTILQTTNDYIIIKALAETAVHPPVQGYVLRIENKSIKLPAKNFSYTKGNMLFDPAIEAMMEEVDTVLYIENITHLQDYGTRNAYTPEAVLAQNWIKEQYEGYGYSVELFDFWMPSGEASDNVIATKVGTKYPDEYVVIGGHYDSYTWSGDSPGADDDASGTCGVMEVARVMADFETDRTVIFCAWSGEEYGLYGSEAWAEWAAGEGLNILGYFNIDMCGYRHPGDEIHTDMIAPASAQPLVDFYTDVCAVYLPEFVIDAGNLTGGDSDHTSFNNAGYMGIFPFEDSQNYSPYIHTINDVVGLSVNSPEMAQYFIKAMVANVATMANWLAPPANLLAIPGDETVELVWNEVLEIDNYHVYKNGEPTPISSPEEPYFLDEAVENYNSYTYYVTCIYSETGDESDPSNTVTVTPLPPMAFPFADDFETGAMYWNFESPWGLSSLQAYSGDYSITESPVGDYPNNIDASATLYSFSLENAESAALSFWTRYELETNYDYSYLEISTNGNNWTELDEFNGMQTTWTEQTYDLEDYLGEPYVLLRFRFYSDTYVTEDGMYIDDLVLEVETSISGMEANTNLTSGIRIHPNPFSNTTTLEVECNGEGTLDIIWLNAYGQRIKTLSQPAKAGKNTCVLARAGMPAGIYFLVVEVNGESLIKKLILQ